MTSTRMRSIFLTIIMILASVSNIAFAFDINGKVVDKEKQSAIYPAVITIPGRTLWAVTDENGAFASKGVPQGN